MSNKKTFFTDTRITGLLYLGLALTGFFVFLFARSKIYVDGNAAATNANLISKELLSRFGIAVEILLVAIQALTAMWFYKLFARVNSFAAGLLAVFGVINAVMILASSAMWLSALNASLAGGQAIAVYNLFSIHETIWLVSGLFFGLWLIPMGYLAGKSKMPTVLSWLLVVGGVGYIVSTLILVLLPDQKTLSSLVIMPATIAEIWIVGYLLTKPKLNIAKS